MRSKADKQCKLLMQIILAPIKILSKAKDFYMKSMVECGGRVGYTTVVFGGPAVSQSVYLPRSFSFVGSSSQGTNQNEEFGQFLQRSTRRESLNMNNMQRLEVRRTAIECSDIGRSYSVGLGKIGRIDEEKPCSFREDEDSYPKSRSHAFRINVA
ncbi:hypothetical protein P3X46_013675 [Hevea brasiliensis]|uniref:Uncharacterized protein n=1 Tax=Hevea brasiliensis TaxID=3981 RepID=A0ABQ9M618_HEVBR|nr:hypothetical protein P3X46_013675 [Hevea brasiliensis]